MKIDAIFYIFFCEKEKKYFEFIYRVFVFYFTFNRKINRLKYLSILLETVTKLSIYFKSTYLFLIFFFHILSAVIKFSNKIHLRLKKLQNF